jgi:hypothetical protein
MRVRVGSAAPFSLRAGVFQRYDGVVVAPQPRQDNGHGALVWSSGMATTGVDDAGMTRTEMFESRHPEPRSCHMNPQVETA